MSPIITCRLCSSVFQITDDDRAFYDAMGVPSPILCPDCRMQRRLIFRNERCLYKRKCDYSGKQIISVYHPASPFKVYDFKDWMSDTWDAMEYGRDIDWNRFFFEQLQELNMAVPKISLLIRNCENSDYVNNEEGDKNCYMIFAGGYCEDSYYSRMLLKSKNCIDCLNVTDCELCYECVNVTNSYHCLYCQNVTNSRDLLFCNDMIGCSDCIACAGLRQKQYCIFNEQHTKGEFEKKKKELMKNLPASIPVLRKEMQKQHLSLPYKYATTINSEDCTGDYILNSKNCKSCFDIIGCQDSSCIWDGEKTRNCRDMMMGYNDELVYNTMGVVLNSYHCMCGVYCWGCTYLSYSQHCFNCNNVFGCIGLKKKEFCILNKQYSKEEYEKLRDKLIAHMKKTGEYGEFFPADHSPFAYNETIAQEYFPLEKESATKQKFAWRDEHSSARGKETIGWKDVPVSMDDVQDSITEEIFACTNCQKNYRIIPQELAFYKRMNLPLPQRCFDCRHISRMNLRNPRKLWNRQCNNCKKPVETSYSPGRPEKIYCEECYLKTTY